MPNRLEFFRKEMAAFAGAVFPQQAINDGLCVPEPRQSVSEIITRRIGLRPTSTHLLLGGIGSGKTTQLLLTRDRINREIEDTEAFYLDASDYTDITKISAGVLTAIVGLALSAIAKDRGYADVQENIKKIDRIAYGYDEIAEAFLPLNKNIILTQQQQQFLGTTLTKKYIPGILTRDRPQNTHIQAIKTISDRVSADGVKIVLLIDGLDRLADNTSFLKMVANDLQEISALNVGVVLVGALHSSYDLSFTEVKKAFDYCHKQPCFDVAADEDSRAFCQAIIIHRSTPDFISEPVANALVDYSGGILRDLINLTLLAIEEAYVADDGDRLTLKHVEDVAKDSAAAKLIDISDEDLEILARVSLGKSFTPHSIQELKLLANSNIIEYNYPKKRYAVHPCLSQYLPIGVANEE